MVPVVLFAFWILFAHTQVDGLETYEINVDKLICMVNYERAKTKLPPLGRNKHLHGAAKEQADYQAKIHRMQHEGEGNCNVGARADRHNYRWNKIAENVAFGFDKPDVVMFQWMCSEGHRKNIVDAKLTEMNIAATKSDKSVVYWAQVFGSIKEKAPESMCDCKPFANDIVKLREYEKVSTCPDGKKVDPGPDDNPYLKGGSAPPAGGYDTGPAAKPAEAKPAEAKPAEAKPAEAKPAKAKPAEAKPAEAKPAEAKPAKAKPAEAKPAEAKPAHKHHHHQHNAAPVNKPPAAHKGAEQPRRQRGGRGRRIRDRNGEGRDRNGEGREGRRRNRYRGSDNQG